MKILLISILLFSSTLFGSIGKITALSGDVSISRASQNISATIGFELEEKDKIATKANARVQLVFQDKTVISLGKNSTFDIEEYFYDTQKPSETKASFKVARGIFKTITGQIGKINPNQFTLKTKSASIGIRGTIFFGDVPPPEIPNQPEIFTCTDGIIVVSTPQGVQQVEANQFTTVTPGQAPTPPQDVPLAQMNDAEQDSGASQNEQESGQDENLFYESNIPTNEVPNEGTPDFTNNDSNDLVEDVIKDNVDSDKSDTTLTPTYQLHYLNLSTTYTVPIGDVPFSYEYPITNDTITSVLGTGSIMKVNDGAGTGFSWGFWSSSGTAADYVAEKAWVLSDKSIVSDLSSLTSANNATYSGKVMGYDSYNSSFINPTNSTITLNFDFGANTTVVNMVINGDSQSMSSINNLTGTYSYSGSKYTITGSNNEILNGSFYDNMNSTAGTVKTDNVNAVYTATQQ
jgi:hypothetical protein